MSKRVLIVEDDPSIAQLLVLHLRDLGYEPEVAVDGIKGAERGSADRYALIILDLMLPGLDGNEVLKRIRQHDKQVPILMLTLKSELIDKVLSLELGADDYMTKPFSVPELVARVKALVRRSQPVDATQEIPQLQEELRFDSLVIDSYRRKVTLDGRALDLTPKQFDLLVFLAQSPGRPYNRSQLLNSVWGYEHSGYEHTVDTHINRLRAQIEPDPAKPKFILTVWGVGYRFAEISELTKESKA